MSITGTTLIAASLSDLAERDSLLTRQLYERIGGYWVTQIIGTAARLGIADLLTGGARASDDMASELGISADGLFRLLRGGVTAGIVQEVSPRAFALTPMGEGLRSDVPFSLRSLAIASCDSAHWLPWGQLAEAIRTGRSTARAALGMDIWEHFAREPDEGAQFSQAMSNLSSMVGGELTRLVDFSRFPHVADIGGSQGALLAQVLQAHPSCRGTLFDLPHVIEGAKAPLEAAGLSGRVALVGGSFFESHLPSADAYLLKHVLHDWDDGSSTTLLRQLHQAAPEGARLFVLEMVMPEAGTPSPVPLMDLNMLVLVDGRERTAREFGALLGTASWELRGITPTAGGTCIIEANKR
ncbi:acetylserotonin O-methyltransferase [Myxococcus sp. RHSTA-1-4]|uniref:acetylserotonin O-methyltransferase n=1 Tax=Myxococcus sp. RHSTA-1-4 TaxID=2874601 RepID=UPI001CBB5C01|nr:acetylserotonin O-methyltransferase [Myxococcus sp. RHSTA-1-4]MBZ4418508.1 SAM-dependent methyltransferase [Myxococcus sp. RHSTA-1-4]